MNRIILLSILTTFTLSIKAQEIVITEQENTDDTIEVRKENKEEFNNKGQKSGKWIKYNSYNRIESKGEYLNGKKNNLWQYFFNNGVLSQSVFYEKGLKHGEIITYNPNGNIQFSGKYFYGKKDGTWKYYTSKKKLYLINNYSKGKETGVNISYHNNGKINFIKKYKGKKSTYKYYNEKGVLREEGMFSGKEKDSIWSYYWYDGKLDRKTQYKNGKKNGLEIIYHKNGKIKRKGEMKNGVRNGKWINYWYNGKVQIIADYISGQRSGILSRFYDKNNQLKTEELWENDLLIEVISYFNIKGELLKLGSLKNGNGTINIYSPSGELMIERIYENGKLKR